MESGEWREMLHAACSMLHAAFHRSVSAYMAKIRKFKRRQRHRGDVDDGDHDESDIGSYDNNNAASVALEQHIYHLVDHANHVLRTLTAKHHSLTNALVAFREASNLHVQQFGIAATASTKNDNTAAEDRQRQILRTCWTEILGARRLLLLPACAPQPLLFTKNSMHQYRDTQNLVMS